MQLATGAAATIAAPFTAFAIDTDAFAPTRPPSSTAAAFARPEVWTTWLPFLPTAGAIGALLIVLPHLIGAPAHEIRPGGVPAELAAEFAIATSVITGLFWLLLGGMTGYFYKKFES